jgi:hypothetical protein
MPDKRASLLVRLIMQNKAKNKREEFSEVTDEDSHGSRRPSQPYRNDADIFAERSAVGRPNRLCRLGMSVSQANKCGADRK